MSTPSDKKDASGARAILFIVVVVEVIFWVLLLAAAVLTWLNIQLIFYHSGHLVLLVFWFLLSQRVSNPVVVAFTALLTCFVLIVDVVLLVVDGLRCWNCLTAGTSCLPPPDTQFTQTLMVLCELVFVGLSITAAINVFSLWRIQFEDMRYSSKDKES